MSTRVVVDPITRIEGHLRIEAENALESADIRCIYSPIYYKTDFCSPVDKYETYNLDVSEFWLNHNFFKEVQDEELKETDLSSTYKCNFLGADNKQ